jgi:hypothetical protein
MATAAASLTRNHGETESGAVLVWHARNSHSTSGYRNCGFIRIAAWNSASNENALWSDSLPAKNSFRRRTRQAKPPAVETTIQPANSATCMLAAGQSGRCARTIAIAMAMPVRPNQNWSRDRDTSSAAGAELSMRVVTIMLGCGRRC